MFPVSCGNKVVNSHGSLVTTFSLPSSALCDFEGQDNVDAEFVEEAALKHTMALLGL